MKTLRNLLLLAFLLIAFGISTQAQWTTSGNDIYNTNTGYVGIGTTAPAEVLHVARNMLEPMVVIENLGSIGGASFSMRDVYSGAHWKFKATQFGTFKIRDHANLKDVFVIEQNAAANSFYIKVGGDVGLGTSTPFTNFHIYESNAHLAPGALLQQAGSGDASFQYYLSAFGQRITTGLDNNDNYNFKISNTTTLTGTTYTDPNTLLRIHTEAGSVGIIDHNKQSRARAYQDTVSFGQAIPTGIWTPVDYDITNYDEHVEFVLAPPPPPPPPPPPGAALSYFLAKEDGYYQVNARTEFDAEYIELWQYGYVSIAIYVTDNSGLNYMYAQGNNLQVVDLQNHQLLKNNAPNVSDVIYLLAGEQIEIWVYQDFATPWAFLIPGSNKTYVSVHKVS